MKGMEKLHEKLPDYPGKRIYLLPLRGIVVALVGYVFLIVMDIIPRVFSSMEVLVAAEPFIPLLGNLIVAVFGFWLIGTLWSRRESMKEKYGKLAYERMIRVGVVGVFLVPSLVFHAATSIRSLPPGPPANQLMIQWSSSLLPLLGVPQKLSSGSASSCPVCSSSLES